ncbi:hypothetical protein EMPS_08158 [Entomortierella parvispora]|uniref:Uncharacterized protein n=1 Tax=Entomortierella parvispora TaxID=205924 RepID=A0A9P3HFV7_9FUNG|nr:hypothetical protein EMPS_08158 [Entomortierella parvispora]
MSISQIRIRKQWLPVLLLSALFLSYTHAQTPTSAISSITTTSTLTEPTSMSPSSSTTSGSPSISASVTTSTAPAERTEGPAVNIFPPGTVNCIDFPGCKDSEECYVMSDGLVCLEKKMNWGYILSRNSSGVPAVPGWVGPRNALNSNCTLFQMPRSDDKPGLALMVYDLISGTLPKDLLLSNLDQATTLWYTLFSNCAPGLTCIQGTCLPRPTLGQSCMTSWQCNSQALGLNENNMPIPTANSSEIRCEYEGGDKSVNRTCQLLKRDVAPASGSGGISAWRVIVPVVVILILLYIGSVVYQRYMRNQKLGKWSRIEEEDRNDYQMDAYDDIQ